MRGLPNDLVSFNIKLRHNLLVPKKELHRIGRAPSLRCNLYIEEEEDDITHSLIKCDFNEGIGELAIRMVRRFNENVDKEALLRLDFGDIMEDQELLIVTYVDHLSALLFSL